jgi:uncharacterized membrane protein YbaN (DUF454 family)
MSRTSEGLRRRLFVVAGIITLAIGIVGIVVPVLPTTPFLLLAAACFMRGSQRAYSMLLSNRFLGGYIRGYVEGRGMTLKAKVWTLVLLFGVIAATALVATDNLVVRVVLGLVLIGVGAHILTINTLR